MLTALLRWVRGLFPGKQKVQSAQRLVAQHIALHEWDAAMKTLSPYLEHKVGGAETWILYCQILRGTRQPEEMLKATEEARRHHPGHREVALHRGKALLDLGMSEAALECLSAVEDVMRNEEDHLDLGTALFLQGKIQQAWEQVAPFVTHSRQGRLYALAADCHYHFKQYRAALIYYFMAEHCGWKTHVMQIRMAVSLQASGQNEEAEQIFQALVSLDSSDVEATLGLGAVLQAKGHYHEALSVYQKGKAWDRCDKRILRQAGLSALHTQQYPFAQLYLETALRQGDRAPETLARLAYALECQKKWHEAEKIYLQLIEDHEDQVAGYRGIAYLFGVGLSTLDPEKALAHAHRAVKILPDAISWELLSACEARIGNFSKAHQIQEQLSSQSHDEVTKKRRHKAMRTLRKNMPLDGNLVGNTLVA